MKLNNVRKIEKIKNRIRALLSKLEICSGRACPTVSLFDKEGQRRFETPDIVVKKIINRAAIQSALCGAISGQAGILGIILDIIPVIEIQSVLVRDIAKFYGKNEEILSVDTEDIGLLVKLGGISLGIRSGIKLSERTSLKVLQRLLVEEVTVVGTTRLPVLIGRKMLVSLPIISSVVYSVLNYISTRNIGLYYWKKLSHLNVGLI